jgi:hypothetical protein
MRKHDGIDSSRPYSIEKNRLLNWAENIADAWELFEEHDCPFISVYNKDGKRIYHAQFTLAYEGIADTAPMAICLAYIAWREEK